MQSLDDDLSDLIPAVILSAGDRETDGRPSRHRIE
jgi:hypothetical protein